jgi:hypothetical protein
MPGLLVLDLTPGRKRIRRERAPYLAGFLFFATIAALFACGYLFCILDPNGT